MPKSLKILIFSFLVFFFLVFCFAETIYPDLTCRWSIDDKVSWTTTRDTTTADRMSESLSSTAYIYEGLYSIFRSALYFDTSGLEGQTIVSASLFVYNNSLTHDDDGNAVVISSTTNTDCSSTSQVNKTNFNFSDDYGSLLSESFVSSSYNEIELNAAGLAAINKTGMTNFSLLNSFDVDDTQPSGVNQISFYGWEESDPPYLVIEVEGGGEATTTPVTATATSTVELLASNQEIINNSLAFGVVFFFLSFLIIFKIFV